MHPTKPQIAVAIFCVCSTSHWVNADFSALTLEAPIPPPVNCIQPGAMQIGQLGFTSQRAQIIQQLGVPQTLEHYQAEDDGGHFAGEILTYPNTQIYFNATRGLQRIITADPTLRLPLNLHLGQTLASIQSRIALTRTRQLDRFTIEVCADETGGDRSNREVYLRFDAYSYQLIGLDMMVYGP